MKREDAERLLHHHYRLHTQVRSRIDNKPPVSMFISPKSTHYKPFATRKPKSLEGTPNPPRRRGQEELAHFLAHKHTPHRFPSSLNSSFNAYARKSMSNLASLTTPSTSAASSRPSTSKTTRPLFDKDAIRAKILDTRTYQPPIHRSRQPPSSLPPKTSHSMSELSRSLTGIYLTNGKSHNSTPSKPAVQRPGLGRIASISTTRSSSAAKNNMDLYRAKYKEFKEAVLSDILRRGVFTDRVIKDSFYREIERRTDLDLNQMEMIMFDTLTELGVKAAETAPAPPPSRAKRPKTAKQRSITVENGKVITNRAPVVDFSAEPDIYIPDDKASQISSLPSVSSGSSASTSSSSEADTARSKSDDEANEIKSRHSSSESDSEATSGSTQSSETSDDEDDKDEAEKRQPRQDRRTSSLPSESSLDYKTPTTKVYKLSSSSTDMEHRIKKHESFQLDSQREYSQRYYGRERSLDREDSM